MKRFWLLGVIFILLWGCREPDSLDVDVSAVPVDLRISRFDRQFYGADTTTLPVLKREYPYLFSSRIPDSVWQAKMQDTLLLKLKKQVDSVFPDNKRLEQELIPLFKHIKYYFPRFSEPRVITLYSDWDYTKRAFYQDSLAFLFLDNFLGTDNPVYKGIPQYIRQTQTPRHLAPAMAEAIAMSIVPPPHTHDFLSKMIYYGKGLYLQKIFLPHIPDSILLKYSSAKMKWAEDNEAQVWLYFLDNKLLYSTDHQLDARFLDWAPFSKFYTPADHQSAGMIGRYIGYRIVSEYMKRTHDDPQKMLRTGAATIFRQSKYKPE